MDDVELIPRKVLFGNPERTSPRISPDAKRLAWLAPDGSHVKADDVVIRFDPTAMEKSLVDGEDEQEGGAHGLLLFRVTFRCHSGECRNPVNTWMPDQACPLLR